ISAALSVTKMLPILCCNSTCNGDLANCGRRVASTLNGHGAVGLGSLTVCCVFLIGTIRQQFLSKMTIILEPFTRLLSGVCRRDGGCVGHCRYHKALRSCGTGTLGETGNQQGLA